MLSTSMWLTKRGDLSLAAALPGLALARPTGKLRRAGVASPGGAETHA